MRTSWLVVGLVMVSGPAMAQLEKSSKLNDYPVLQAGAAAEVAGSKVNVMPVLKVGAPGTVAGSKVNVYVVLQTLTLGGQQWIVHSFPP